MIFIKIVSWPLKEMGKIFIERGGQNFHRRRWAKFSLEESVRNQVCSIAHGTHRIILFDTKYKLVRRCPFKEGKINKNEKEYAVLLYFLMVRRCHSKKGKWKSCFELKMSMSYK